MIIRDFCFDVEILRWGVQEPNYLFAVVLGLSKYLYIKEKVEIN